jgi:hypothetical protein
MSFGQGQAIVVAKTITNLGSGVLAGNAIGTELEVRLSTFDVLVVGIIQVTIDDLLGEGQGPAQSVVDDIVPGGGRGTRLFSNARSDGKDGIKSIQRERAKGIPG